MTVNSLVGEHRVKRTVVVGDGDILSVSINQLLTGKADWHVVCLPTNPDTGSLITTILGQQPDIVIISHVCFEISADLIMQLLREHSEIILARLSLESNYLEVYSKHTIMITGSTELISVLADA